MPDTPLPEALRLQPALARFVEAVETQSQKHIKLLHQHLALRLVIEGGFLPEEITPRPAIRAELRGRRRLLIFDETVASTEERTVLGGLKTKAIDIVIDKAGVGPVVAISVKGTTGAFRNLTNRMEEAIGDSTNLHIMYPGLVYGFFQVIKANRYGTPGIAANDLAIDDTGQVVPLIQRYHEVLMGLTGRRFVRNDFTRYETVALACVESTPDSAGTVLDVFPAADSPLRVERFMPALLQVYDLRFPYIAASIPSLRRRTWSRESPALQALGLEADWVHALGYTPRVE